MSPLYRILHIVASMQGGAAQHVLHLAQAFRERGHLAAISAPCDNPAFEDRLRALQIPLYESPLNVRFPMEAIFQLRAILEGESWTHIHVHGHRAALIGRFAVMLTRDPAPAVYTVHGYHPPHYSNRIAQWFVNGVERILSRWTAGFICVSRSVQNDLLSVLPQAANRCAIVENAIPLPQVSKSARRRRRAEIRAKYAIPEDAYVVGTVGRLQWQKSVSRLLRAFRLFHNNHEDAFLLIVGDGPDRNLLEMLAHSLHIARRCLFVGHRENPWEFYDAMDVFVLASLWEGLPLTILEAWAAGIPVIATDAPGSRDIVEDGVAGLLAENSIQGIALAMERLRSHPETIPILLQNAQAALNQRFSLRRMVAQTEQVYRRTLRADRI